MSNPSKRRSSPHIGMDDNTRNIYEVARFVGLPCGRLDAFFKVLKMCGYEVAPLPRDQAPAPALVTTDEPAPRVAEPLPR